ncbi:MAG TPA: FAD-linked oxidase C-terminal domain-containing protein [Burkholderiales bacterium]|nr:FAD-linked oxidase C-terminal domain-containing protein [Burkholderiales bacterium]
MNAPLTPVSFVRGNHSSLAARLRKQIDAEVMFDAASRGRYSTDASIYQVEPIGVVVPRSEEAARAAIAIAVENGVPILPRGAGSSQCGQAVGAALVIDHTKYLNKILEIGESHAVVQPGVVLDHLNAALRKHGLWFPVDVSTSAQATLGGMAGNNSCGSRSIEYGNMVHNVLAIEAVTATGCRWRFADLSNPTGPEDYLQFIERLKALYEREKAEIELRFPKVLRKVAGYNFDHLGPPHANAAHLLVGSEGTLAYSERIHLKLSPLPAKRSLGVCHFPKFYTAMDLTQHIVKLEPTAVELVDRTMIGLARENPAFEKTVNAFIRGDPDAILLVEFADERAGRLKDLVQLMADLGLPGSVVEITDSGLQRAVWEVRKAGLNIMMSMKGDGKPVSFIEDCAVPLEHLAEYTGRLTRVFEKHGTRGTWYAHASVGTLHVRPVLDMRRDGAEKMRAIAEEACAMVKEYKGAYSGEHGDGLVRSEWIAPFFGPRLTAALAEIKSWLDPKGLMNPGKIVNPSRMDDRRLFRFKPGYATTVPPTVLDWSEWGGYDKAVEMCNNNGHCRKFDAGTMCPSYRATLDEVHLTRGRANTLRLALSNQLALEEVKDALDLCVSCKGCKRECPTGVDMARMKIEFLAHYKKRNGWSARDKAIGYLPRYAAWAARFAPVSNFLSSLAKNSLGFSEKRNLPRWRTDFFAEEGRSDGDVVLFVDTFNRYFEPENARAALRVLEAAGYRVHAPRGLCCGRTFLSVGLLDEAKREARRLIETLAPYAQKGVPIVGLEPSCLFSLRDEFPVLVGDELAKGSYLFEEFLAANPGKLKFRELQREVLLHGHCHQKAFDAMPAVEKVLGMVPGLKASTVQTSCCGMAGSFGYEAEHYDVSMKMAELSLLPAVRNCSAETLLVADGTSCRHQIADGTGRVAVHVARLLERALA